MKAQRRHELQTNTLANALTHPPDWLQRHGAKVLFVVAAALLIIVLVRYRSSTRAQMETTARQALARARGDIEQIAVLPMEGPTAEQIRAAREQLRTSASASLDVVQASDDPTLQAEAQLARGDLNWFLYTIPDAQQQSTTQPAALGTSPAELLDAAAMAYQSVIEGYPQEQAAVMAARFGLAVIAETRSQWDSAREQYLNIVDGDGFEGYKSRAEERLLALDKIKQPVMLVEPPAPATAPTASAAIAPATRPSTAPVP